MLCLCYATLPLTAAGGEVDAGEARRRPDQAAEAGPRAQRARRRDYGSAEVRHSYVLSLSSTVVVYVLSVFLGAAAPEGGIILYSEIVSSSPRRSFSRSPSVYFGSLVPKYTL